MKAVTVSDGFPPRSERKSKRRMPFAEGYIVDIKGFLLRFFAAVGIIIPFLLGMFFWGLANSDLLPSEPAQELPKQIVLELDFTQPLVEQSSGFELSLPALMEEGTGQPFFPLVLALRKAKKDPRVKSVVAHLGPYAPSLVHAQELATALQDFRESGKPTYIFGASYGAFGPGGTSYYLASQFEHIWLQPVGSVGLTGMGIEAPFAKTALKEWGIETDFLRREEYKSVMENVSRDNFSPPVKKNMQSMMQSLANQMAKGIATGRKIELKKAQQLMAEGPYTANEALKKGLVTHIGYEDEMMDKIKEEAGKEGKRVEAETYLYLSGEEDDEETKANVALIYAEGMIAETPAKGPYRVAQDSVIDAASVIKAFKVAIKDEDIRAILFRVNSPGGSPVASETMRRGLLMAKEASKPVFVSMGRVAASGGYWIAMDAHHIVADPATITGSIGVVAGKIVLGGLYNKLGIKWDSLTTSENAQMSSTRQAFSPQARARMTAMIDETYKIFTDNVAAARKIPKEKMADIAKGRVFTGEQALKVGLVDELGGMETTVAAIKKELKIKADEKIALVLLPPPETPRAMIMQLVQDLMSGSVMIKDIFSQLVRVKAALGVFLDAAEGTNGPSVRLPFRAAY